MKQPRSVHRALDVLEFLAENGACGLHAIHRGTGLSKSTLRRLLATLAERGYVRVGLTDQMYRSNVATPVGLPREDVPRIARLINAARPHMTSLTRATLWPAGLHFFVRGRMRLVETTHGLSPFRHTPGVALDSELNIFAAASGLAWLAANTDATVLEIVESLKGSEAWSLQRFAVTPQHLLRDLAMVRERGWALRRTSQGLLDGRTGMAVALRENCRPVGALTLTWPHEAMPAEDFAAKHFAALSSAAAAINEALSENTPI